MINFEISHTSKDLKFFCDNKIASVSKNNMFPENDKFKTL